MKPVAAQRRRFRAQISSGVAMTAITKQACIFAVACLVVLVPGFTLASPANSAITLTVDAGGCSAFEINDLSQKFHYTAKLDALVLGACASSTVS